MNMSLQGALGCHEFVYTLANTLAKRRMTLCKSESLYSSAT